MSTCFMLASWMIRTVIRLRVTRDTTKPQMLRKVLFDTGGNHLNSHQERVCFISYFSPSSVSTPLFRCVCGIMGWAIRHKRGEGMSFDYMTHVALWRHVEPHVVLWLHAPVALGLHVHVALWLHVELHRMPLTAYTCNSLTTCIHVALDYMYM